MFDFLAGEVVLAANVVIPFFEQTNGFYINARHHVACAFHDEADEHFRYVCVKQVIPLLNRSFMLVLQSSE